MNHSIKTGISFGLTSAIITTLGLMVGLNSSTHSKLVVVGGILIIAIADAFSDALGIHLSEEAENIHTTKEIWEATASTFLTKFIFASTFIVPVLIFTLGTAVIVSVAYGMLLLGLFSFYIARKERISPFSVIAEHLVIAMIVIFITNYLGNVINRVFV